MTEIVLRSGYVTGQQRIIEAARKAAVEAVIKGAIDTANTESKTFPRDTGATERQGKQAIKQSGAKFVGSFNRSGGSFNKIVVSGKQVLGLMLRHAPKSSEGHRYLQYHVVQHPSFKAGQNYQNGRQAINMDTVMTTYARNVRNRIKKELRKQGIDAT